MPVFFNSNTTTEKELQDMYNYSHSAWSGYLDEAHKDVAYYLGAQFTKQEMRNAEVVHRHLLVFNKIKRQVKLLSGYEVRNRHILKISPIGTEDDDVSLQHSKLIQQQMALFGGYNVLSACFKMGQLISGSNLMEMYRDRNGFMQFARLGYNQHLLDPAVTQQDLSDCSFYLTGRYLSEGSVKQLLPTGADKISSIPHSEGNIRWDSLADMHYNSGAKKRLYEELWELRTEFKKVVVSRVSGQDIELKELVKRYDGDTQRARRVVDNAKMPDGTPALSLIDKPEKKVTLTTFIDGVQVWKGPNPLGIDEYNVSWFPGEYFHEVDRSDLKLQPFVRSLRDPQKAKNRRINQTIDIIESQLTNYKIVRENAIKNFQDVFESGQGRTLVVKTDFDEMDLSNVFRQETAPEIPAGHFNLLNVLDKEETEVGGMNDEIFGSDNAQIPGILARHRTGQALTGHQDLFEIFRIGKKLVGKKLMKANQINQDPIRVFRMINEMPVPGFYDADLCYYDAIPTEGMLTDNQQQQLYAELKEIKQTFPDAAEVISMEDIIDALPVMAKKKLKEGVARREQAKAQAQQQAQEDQQRMNRLVEAETEAKIARAQEDISDVAVNRAATQLKNAQAVAELQNVENDQLTDLAERIAKIALMEAQTKAANAQAKMMPQKARQQQQARKKRKGRK